MDSLEFLLTIHPYESSLLASCLINILWRHRTDEYKFLLVDYTSVSIFKSP